MLEVTYDRDHSPIDAALSRVRLHPHRDHADGSVCLVLGMSGLRCPAATKAGGLLRLLLLWQRALPAGAGGRGIRLLRLKLGGKI